MRWAVLAPTPAPYGCSLHDVRLQAVGLGLVALACGGGFYLNGSYTHVDRDTGETATYSGGETLHVM